MANRKISIVSGEYYHVFNRGNNKSEIFFDNEDRDRFLKLLYLCNSTKAVNFRDCIVERKIDTWEFDRGKRIVSIGAWVLMPNHFHIYLIENPKGNLLGRKGKWTGISTFMSKLCTAYAKYINTKYYRTGTIFEGTFKAEHVINNDHAKYLFSYIHLNPIKLIESKWKEEGIKDIDAAKKFLNGYWWSSYFDYLKPLRKERQIINPLDFPRYFKDSKVFEGEIFEWLTLNPKGNLLGKS